ncbi:MAG TPA: CvpA family protein [Thermodesulfobacteriota bacterium]|nr:CvpA family protein [Thermodesulfobacteriota bacterium]
MNWLDITIIAIIALFTLVGFSKGLISQIFSIAALAGGLVIGFIFYDLLGGVFIKEGVVDNRSIANVGSFIVLVFVSYVIIQIAGWITTKLIGTLQLSWLNRICGAAAGAVMGAVTALLLSSCLTLFYPEKDPVIKNSVILPYLRQWSLIVKDALPGDFEKSFNRAKELIRKEGLEAAMRIRESEAVKEILKKSEDLNGKKK